MVPAVCTAFLAPQIHFPSGFNTSFLMLVRWIHFLAGITWIGLLYFFNLVRGYLVHSKRSRLAIHINNRC